MLKIIKLFAIVMPVLAFILSGCSTGNTQTPETGIPINTQPEAQVTTAASAEPTLQPAESSPAIVESTTSTPTPSLTLPLASTTPVSTPATVFSETPSSTVSTTPTATSEEILAKARTKWSELLTYAYELNAKIKLDIVSGDVKVKMDMDMTGQTVTNISVHEMQMDGEMVVKTKDGAKVTMPMVVYLVNGWQYTKISLLGKEQWVKNQIALSSYDSKDEIQKILDLSGPSSSAKISGSELVQGVECFLLEIVPVKEELAKWVGSLQQSQLENAGISAADLIKAIKSMSFKVWIAADTFLLKKAETIVNFNMKGVDYGKSAAPGDYVIMDVNQVMITGKYNEPVSIVLPPESQDASAIQRP